MTNEKFMREALKEAHLAQKSGDWAIGCVITLDDKIVARGRNYVFTNKNRLLHAEIDAINKLQTKHFKAAGKNFTLYTTLEPCPMCFGAILLAGIHTVVAGTNLDDSGASAYIDNLPAFFRQPRFETSLITGILAQECAAVWLSCLPAQALLTQGFVLKKQVPNGEKIKTYITPTDSGKLGKVNNQRWLHASRLYVHSLLPSIFPSERLKKNY